MSAKNNTMSERKKAEGVSRRDFIKATGAGVMIAGLGANIIIPGKARAGRKKLKIFKFDWNRLMPTFEKWFQKTYVKEWGEKNDTEVTIDTGSSDFFAILGVASQKGHDLFQFLWLPPAAYEEQVIDHREIYEECKRKYGKPIDLATRSTYNPKTKKYFAFSPSFTPQFVNYRKDLWDEIDVFPDTWDDVRTGGRKIKKKHGNLVGISLGKDPDSENAVQAIMYSFGASVQDQAGNVILNSKETLEAVKFVKALYEEAMDPVMLFWDHASNNDSMLSGEGSLTLNPVTITREAERENSEISKKIQLAKIPQGPFRRIGPTSFPAYVIWKFAENIEGAKKFLLDFVDNFQKAFLASEFNLFPCFPKAVPDLKVLIANDPKGHPPTKYRIMEDALGWTTNLGYPGYTNAAIDEISGRNVISEMFAKAARGDLKPEDAIKEAEVHCNRIFAEWKEKGLI